jgi:hypothetical protein
VEDERSILEKDPPVHDRLAVHRDPHVVVGHAEEVVRLYHLEALVH